MDMQDLFVYFQQRSCLSRGQASELCDVEKDSNYLQEQPQPIATCVVDIWDVFIQHVAFDCVTSD